MTNSRPRSVRSQRRPQRTSERSLPLSADELLNYDNSPPTKQVPDKWAKQFTRQSVVFVAPKKFKPNASIMQKSRDGVVWSFELPDGVDIGLPGGTKRRISYRRVKGGRQPGAIPSFRPEWASQVVHPKRASSSTEPLMRSLAQVPQFEE